MGDGATLELTLSHGTAKYVTPAMKPNYTEFKLKKTETEREKHAATEGKRRRKRERDRVAAAAAALVSSALVPSEVQKKTGKVTTTKKKTTKVTTTKKKKTKEAEEALNSPAQPTPVDWVEQPEPVYEDRDDDNQEETLLEGGGILDLLQSPEPLDYRFLFV